MADVVSGQSENFPSLESICDLFRALINDTFSSGAGQIATDSAPFMLPFLNSALRDLYSDLRLINSMTVLRDNYILAGIPGITADAATQVCITTAGYFNGSTWNSNFVLPAGLLWIVRLYSRQTGSNSSFFPLDEAPAGIAGILQDSSFCTYEVRGDGLWLNGATLAQDLRFRYMATFPDFTGSTVDFANTYVPIADCTNAVAQKMVAYYAQRLSPEQFPLAEQQAIKFTNKLKAESVRNSQNKSFARKQFIEQ